MQGTDWYTVEQFAIVCGVSESTARKWIKDKWLTVERDIFTGGYLIHKDAAETFLLAHHQYRMGSEDRKRSDAYHRATWRYCVRLSKILRILDKARLDILEDLGEKLGIAEEGRGRYYGQRESSQSL